jgi:hypothetical protein
MPPSALKWNALATDTACEGVLPPPQRGSNGRAVAHPAGRSPRRVFPHSHVVILHDLVAPRSCADLCTAAGKGWAYLHGSGPYPSRLAAPPVCPCLQGVHGNPSAARCQGCVRPRPCAALPLSSCVARLLPREDTAQPEPAGYVETWKGLSWWCQGLVRSACHDASARALSFACCRPACPLREPPIEPLGTASTPLPRFWCAPALTRHLWGSFWVLAAAQRPR